MSRRGRILAGIAAAILVLPPTLLAAFPWGLVVSNAQGPLSRAIGRRVTIASARRIDWFSLWPMVDLNAVSIGRPAWQGTGEMAHIAHARVQFAALPLLLGRFRPTSLDISGLRADLFRDAAGRENWQDARKPGQRPGPKLEHVAIVDGRVRLIDRRRHMTLNATFAVDAGGFRVAGQGRHRGQPLTLAVRGGTIVSGRPQMLRVFAASPLATISASAKLDRPLDLSAFTAAVRGDGTDLTYFNDFVQAGLFPTRPFGLTGQVRREGDRWRIERLAGRVGRSRLAATVVVTKAGRRRHLDGQVAAATLDFDDFTSADQRVQAAALRRATGPRLIPATPIRLDALALLDGTIRIDAARLLSAGPSPFRTLRTTVTLDHRHLVAAPLRAGLTSGSVAGQVTVDDRGTIPRLTVDLRLSHARIERLVLPKGELAGALAARVRLSGEGDTARAAMGRANGKVGIVIAEGDMRRDYAIFAGGDIIKSVGQLIGGGGDRRVAVRCVVGDFAVRGGRMMPHPLVLDTPILRADGSGAVLLAGEKIELSLVGRARRPGLLQSTAPVRLFGTLSAPRVDIRPPRAEGRGKGGMFARLGFLINGLKTRGDTSRAAAPAPVDCAGLSRAALG